MQAFKQLRQHKIFSVIDKAGYLYGVFAAKSKEQLVGHLDDNELTVKLSTIKSVFDPNEVEIIT